MDMVSIKKFLGPERPKPEDYIRCLRMLLDGISIEAVETNESDLSRFRQEVSNIAGQLSSQSTLREIEGAVGFVIRAVTGYNRMEARIIKAHIHELQAMLAMMTTTIAFLSDSSKTGIAQLQVVEKNLQLASTVGDVRILRGKLNACLALVRSETARLRDESQSRIVELQAGVERTAAHVRAVGVALPEAAPVAPQKPVPAMPSGDLLMGMQDRAAAEDRITSNILRGREFIITVFLVDRFAHIDGRFGSRTANEVLLLLARHLGEHLDAPSLFRWSGPAFAALTEADRPLDAIEQQMMQIAAKRFEKTLETENRTALLPITCSFMVRKVSDADSLDDIAGILDDFVATRA